MKSRCNKCVHRKVCPYKEYFTEKEADGIDKCTNFKREKTIGVSPRSNKSTFHK